MFFSTELGVGLSWIALQGFICINGAYLLPYSSTRSDLRSPFSYSLFLTSWRFISVLWSSVDVSPSHSHSPFFGDDLGADCIIRVLFFWLWDALIYD